MSLGGTTEQNVTSQANPESPPTKRQKTRRQKACFCSQRFYQPLLLSTVNLNRCVELVAMAFARIVFGLVVSFAHVDCRSRPMAVVPELADISVFWKSGYAFWRGQRWWFFFALLPPTPWCGGTTIPVTNQNKEAHPYLVSTARPGHLHQTWPWYNLNVNEQTTHIYHHPTPSQVPPYTITKHEQRNHSCQ